MALLHNTLGFLYFCVFVASGQMLARAVLREENALLRILMGGVASLVMLLWLPALFSFMLKFTLLSQLLALLVCVAIGLFCFRISRRHPCMPFSFAQEKGTLLLLLPLFLLGVFLFFTHTLASKDGALHVGQSTFGDLPLHLGFVTSIGEQGFFPPQYSILPGTQVGYPFLCDSISATFYVLGASLRFSMLLPAIFAYALVLLGVYCFFQSWLRDYRIVRLATLLFFIGGGLGFVYFFDQAKTQPDLFRSIFEAFYKTPTNNIEVGVKWVNPIADMLIPQRATLFGWALLFPALTMLHKAAFLNERHWFIPLGILAGSMPLVHTHSFLALGIVSAVYLFYALLKRQPQLRGWLFYGFLAIALAAPQLLLFTFRQSSGFLQFHFNWANTTDSFLWFYIKNLGLLFLLLPVAYCRLGKEDRVFYGGALAIWILAELIQFQPNPYDNNKLLFVWFAFTCGIVAKLFLELYSALHDWRGKRYLAGITVCLLFLSGLLTLGRECVSDFQLFSANEVEATDFIKAHTAPDALFLTASNHNNAVASLTGRNILCGTGSYLYYHGVDYAEREQHLTLLYEKPAQYFHTLASAYGINYVWLSTTEYYTFFCDVEYFEQYPLVFHNNTVRIYDVRGIIPSP